MGDGSEELVTVRNVEVAKLGDWPAVTGKASLTVDKLRSMAETLNAPWHSGAPQKIGHYDPRFKLKRDGDPALGWLTNARFDGESLIVDVEKVPRKFAPRMTDAFRNRSIEWEEDYADPGGTKHPAVLRGLALLGATEPGIAGLADILDLYEAASVGKDDDGLCAAWTGENGEAIVSALSALSEVIHAPMHESMHDEEIETPGGKMAETDARLREYLKIGEEDDVQAAMLAYLDAEASDPGTPNEDQEGTEPAPVTPPVEPPPADEPQTDKVLVSQAYLDDLAAKANAGAEAAAQLRKQALTEELKAASREGKVAPVEFDALLEEMSASPSGEATVRKMLAIRPKVLATQEIGTQAVNQTASVDVDASVRSFFGEGK